MLRHVITFKDHEVFEKQKQKTTASKGNLAIILSV